MPQQAEQPNETILWLRRILEAPDMEKGPKQARWYFSLAAESRRQPKTLQHFPKRPADRFLTTFFLKRRYQYKKNNASVHF